MTNHISQTPQQITRSGGPSVKLENKALLEKETSKDTTGFSNLLAEWKLVGKKLSKTTSDERQKTDVKIAIDQISDQTNDHTGEQNRVTSDEKNEQSSINEQAPQKVKLISLFEMVASGERPLADNRNNAVAMPKHDQPPAENSAKRVQVEKITSAMERILPEDVSIEGRLAAKTSAGTDAAVANVIKQSQAPLQEAVKAVPIDIRLAKTVANEQQRHQGKGDWKDTPAARAALLDQPVIAKDGSQKKTFPNENLQRVKERSFSPEKPVVDVASQKGAETVEVVENRKVTNFPADMEKQAWIQISQKIVPSLIDPEITQNSASSEKATTPQPVSPTVSKTVKYLKIQLKPENLGTVQVNLTMSNGSLEVVLSASDRRLAGRLLEHSDHLTRQLKVAGITFESLSVQIAETDMTSATRITVGSNSGDAALSFNEQKQSQANNKSFAQTKQQQPDDPNQRHDNHDQNDESFQPIDHGVNARGNILL